MASTAPLLTVALIGQPNVGKSTIFNLLTGLNQHVANWPGKTSERRTGIGRLGGALVHVVDLPGTYSLTAGSEEERIARDFVIRGRPDVVAVIADAAALERNLYLLSELLYLPVPVVLGLNMMDVAAQQQQPVEAHVLEAALGLPVVPMVATRNQGVRELLETAVRVAQQPQTYAPRRPEIRADHAAVLREVGQLIAGRVPAPYPEEWVALKLLEGDAEVNAMAQGMLGDDWAAVHDILRRHEDAVLAVASGRYEWIGRMMRAAVRRPQAGQVTTTDRLDRVATHPVWGFLLLLAVLGLTFGLTYAVGTPLQGLLDTHLVQAGAAWARSALAGAPPWVGGLVADGVIAGVGLVLTFLPILLVFFAVLGLLEDVGYIARAAYVTDRFMHVVGLHGKSFLPLFLGFGCNVPAVMASRIIDSSKARLLTILLAPFVPCPARMTVVAVLAPIFFGMASPWVAVGLMILTVAMLALVGLALHEICLGGEHLAFIMDMPLYHRPDLRAIARSVWDRLVDFLQVAGSIILIVSVALWALMALPTGEVETSYLATFGRLLAPLGQHLGLDWQMMVALLTSFVRKENTIATLGVLYGSGHEGVGLA
ncbi:MAG: ferrous iron transport protein B, partial [Chloroflexi bacterium]|nr:ferrous iron transport protein B [Chloroflexota bacterium]